jgi:hypothetical protein
MAGNPTRTSGFFYDTHHLLRDRWHTMHVSCLDVPRAQGHIEDIKAKYGDASNAYRVRVLGEFPTSDDETVIPLELVLGAVGRNVSTLDYHPVWGVDIARFGDDRTALAKRQKNKLLEPVKSWNSTDLMATAGKIKAEYTIRCQAKRNFGRHHWPGRWGLRPLQGAWPAGARRQCRRGGGFARQLCTPQR